MICLTRGFLTKTLANDIVPKLPSGNCSAAQCLRTRWWWRYIFAGKQLAKYDELLASPTENRSPHKSVRKQVSSFGYGPYSLKFLPTNVHTVACKSSVRLLICQFFTIMLHTGAHAQSSVTVSTQQRLSGPLHHALRRRLQVSVVETVSAHRLR